MNIRHINKKKSGKNCYVANLYKEVTEGKVKRELLWGDRVRVLDDSGDRARVRARGVTGFVEKSRLSTESLLELYFIDVGQGDGVLIRTPDHRHILIDGGWPRRAQPTGKNAADFVDWKFVKDYGDKVIKIDAMICSHNDQDHYGGLWDLLDPQQFKELDAEKVSIEHFYHAGLSWWKGTRNRTLGPSTNTKHGEMWTRLLGDRASLESALLTSGGQPKLAGEWRDFLQTVQNARTSANQPTPVTRLDNHTGVLAQLSTYALKIHVLAPVAFKVNGKPAIRKFPGKPHKNTNGNSVLLQLVYKDKVRILLTGDLNAESQQSLLKDYTGNTDVFAAGVTKACHHGSGDVSQEFLETIMPGCTIISSGDSEGHDHPRPEIVAASGITGHRTVQGDRLLTPLVYSTELARSIPLGTINRLEALKQDGTVAETYDSDELNDLRTNYSVIEAGARTSKRRTSRLAKRKLADKTTYGLINVRTDGMTIMCAALNEKNFKWNVTTFKTRF